MRFQRRIQLRQLLADRIEGMQRALVEQGQLQLDLFDQRNLVELSSPEYPVERLVACRNPDLAKLRAHKREELLASTERNLEKIKARVDAGKPVAGEEIGLHVGKVVHQYKMAKHFELVIGDNTLGFARKLDAIAAEAALDGIYVIRTSVSAAQMDGPDCVRTARRWPPSFLRQAQDGREFKFRTIGSTGLS